METLNALVAKILADQLPQFSLAELAPLVEGECLALVEEIRQVLADDGLDDETCFRRVENLVILLENRGISCGNRHDFG